MQLVYKFICESSSKQSLIAQEIQIHLRFIKMEKQVYEVRIVSQVIYAT